MQDTLITKGFKDNIVKKNVDSILKQRLLREELMR